VVVSEYYVWSADLSGRQIRTFANLKVRAPKPATKTDANLKAHLLGIRSCRAPKPATRTHANLKAHLLGIRSCRAPEPATINYDNKRYERVPYNLLIRRRYVIEASKWYRRGYLPHFDSKDVIQFITLRLNDALPAAVIDRTKIILIENEPNESNLSRSKKYRKVIEEYADKGFGRCLFKEVENARILKDILLGCEQEIHCWVIMPNHIHFMMKRNGEISLSNFVKRLKMLSTIRINDRTGSKGAIWQRDYFDRYIRDEAHYAVVKNYIKNNPINAGLVNDINEWEWYGEMER